MNNAINTDIDLVIIDDEIELLKYVHNIDNYDHTYNIVTGNKFTTF